MTEINCDYIESLPEAKETTNAELAEKNLNKSLELLLSEVKSLKKDLSSLKKIAGKNEKVLQSLNDDIKDLLEETDAE